MKIETNEFMNNCSVTNQKASSMELDGKDFLNICGIRQETLSHNYGMFHRLSGVQQSKDILPGRIPVLYRHTHTIEISVLEVLAYVPGLFVPMLLKGVRIFKTLGYMSVCNGNVPVVTEAVYASLRFTPQVHAAVSVIRGYLPIISKRIPIPYG